MQKILSTVKEPLINARIFPFCVESNDKGIGRDMATYFRDN